MGGHGPGGDTVVGREPITASKIGHGSAEIGEYRRNSKPTDSSKLFAPSLASDENAPYSSRVHGDPDNSRTPFLPHAQKALHHPRKGEAPGHHVLNQCLFDVEPYNQSADDGKLLEPRPGSTDRNNTFYMDCWVQFTPRKEVRSTPILP